jgi:galactonate dehydratase
VKVADVRTVVVGAPWRDLTFVELETEEGLIGVGEVRLVNKTETLLACIRELAPRYVFGMDPFDLSRLAWSVQTGEYGRPGEVAMSALAAVDMACWDLIGQELGVPVWALLGGRFHDRIPAYANGWYQSDRDPQAIGELAEQVTGRGYRALKLDPFGSAWGGLSPAERRRSVAIVAAVRESVGPDVEIAIEMHGRFTAAEAVRICRMLEPIEPAWIEEPVPAANIPAYRQVRAGTSLPIASGERVHTLADFREFVEAGCVDIVQVDLTHFGGLSGIKRLAGWVEAYDLQMAPHNVCGPIGTLANIHFGAATPCFRILEHFNDFADPWVQELVDHPPRLDQETGSFEIPERPGLGASLQHDVCREYPGVGARLTLFQPGWERRMDPDHQSDDR